MIQILNTKPEKQDPLTCIELFAGAGGLMLGLEHAGFKTLLANELHPHPCLTLRRNFPDVPVVQASIRDLSAIELLKLAGLHKKMIGNITLLAGGPPCQGFSTAGLKDQYDPRNTLIGDFIRMIREFQPRFFILENVPGLASMHGGRLFENVLSELAATKYQFHHKILVASNYGIPQMRKRLIVIGARDGKPPSHPEATHSNGRVLELFGARKLPNVTCGDALTDLPEIEPGTTATEYTKPPSTTYQRLMRAGASVLFNHQASKHRQETMDYYSLVPPGGTWLDIPEERRNGKQGVQRWPLQGLSRAITTEPTDFIHPTMHRIPTVRELARIQSFPDNYEFLGQRTTGNRMRRLGYCSQTQQVGNAVPPLLAKAVGQVVRDATL